MVGAPPVVMFTTTLERCLITLQERREGLRRLVGAAVLRIARMQMHDRGARFGSADRGIGDLLRGDRQMRRHRRRMDRAGDGAGDDDFAAFRHVSNPGRFIVSEAAGIERIRSAHSSSVNSRRRRSNRSTSPALWYSPKPTRSRVPRTSTTMFFAFSRACHADASG